MFVSSDRLVCGAVDVSETIQSCGSVRMRCTVDGAILWLDAGWTGPSRSLIRRLTHRFVIAMLVLFGEVLGRDDRSCMGSPLR